jgi:hypothetical protein
MFQLAWKPHQLHRRRNLAHLLHLPLHQARAARAFQQPRLLQSLFFCHSLAWLPYVRLVRFIQRGLCLLMLHDEAFAICWIRRRRTTSRVLDERPLEKAAACDVEALAATLPIVSVTPLLDVRWTPQIRSISGAAPDKGSDRKFTALPTKRARSPPPSNFNKPRNLFPDPHAKSAPPHTLSFSQHETPRPAKSSRGDLSPPVTPQALAVSGMETRSLGRPGVGSELVV